MDDPLRAFLTKHAATFNTAVTSGDFDPLVALFADDAELVFEGVPVGPFVGKQAIAAAYAAQPPDDGFRVLDVHEEKDGTIVERFAWHRGGGGQMRFVVLDGRIVRLTVRFDPASE